jgi:quercetin dioxygenase-like cupin family protein
MLKSLTIKPKKVIPVTLVKFATLLLISAQVVSAQDKPTLNRTVLLENRIELPSNIINAKTIRVIFPSAFKTPWHTHEGPGPRYVVKGQLKVIEGGKTNTYSVGDVFWESGNLMSVENIGEGSAELIIFELGPAN